MRRTVISKKESGFTWVDVCNPTPEVLAAVAAEFHLHRTSVQDCLQPDHLPKMESIGALRFILVRAIDDEAPARGDTVQELTRKLAIFFGDTFLVTIHRADQNYIKVVRDKWTTKKAEPHSRAHVINDLLRGAALSFEKPIGELEKNVGLLEEQVFGDAGKKTLEQGYYLRRRAAALKQTLRMSHEILTALRNIPVDSEPFFQDLREMVEHLAFRATEALENVNLLLTLHISLAGQRVNEASQKTNEVMRLLTVFSVVFLPLNFIAGIYGMNFEHMPELKWEYGYFLILGAMLLVATAILSYFHRKGWMKRPEY